MSPDGAGSAQSPEEPAQVLGQQLRLFHGREVPAAGHVGEAAQVTIDPLGPLPRAGLVEQRHRSRDLDALAPAQRRHHPRGTASRSARASASASGSEVAPRAQSRWNRKEEPMVPVTQ
jgi:hypothetical protein